MSPKRRQPLETGAKILLSVAALAALVGIAVWSGFLARGGAPAASDAPMAPVTLATPDPKVVAAELIGLAPELSPGSAELLAREFPWASGQGLAETALIFASRGFDLMERAELLEMGQLLDEVYATLPPPDRDWMGEYMRSLRDGTFTTEASVRGRQLLTQGVNHLPPERRLRLQALIEKAVRGAIAARRSAQGRTPPPVTPIPAPLQPFAPQPPNSLAPETGMVPSPSPSASPARGEAYWRSRMKEAREKVASLKKEVEELDRITRQNLGSTSKRLEELTKARQELAAAERAIGEIEDEARKAGALPGWLRE